MLVQFLFLFHPPSAEKKGLDSTLFEKQQSFGTESVVKPALNSPRGHIGKGKL